jgi:large subunit ribosomal protein L30
MTEAKKTARQPKKKKDAGILQLTLLRSPIGTTYRHKATIRALGLRRIGQTVEQPDTPQLQGMLAKVGHMLLVQGKKTGTGKEKEK